jgi:hypothetical protein
MYEDLLDDPEVQEMITKYDGAHPNDMPLDEFGQPLEDVLDELSDEDNSGDVKDDTKADTKEVKTEDAPQIDESFLAEYVEDVPEIDYTPQTEFAKSLDLEKIDEGFQKYILTHLEPLSLTDEEGKEIKAYTADDIPKDFKFADQQAVTKASTELARLEARGDALQKEYDEALANRENTIAQNELRVSEREGLTEAIQNGEFPKLELDKDGKIDEDSKVNQLANDVIAYLQEINKDRTPSRAISFDTALNRFTKENPDRFKDLDGSLAKEDEARNNFAKRTSRSSQRAGTNSSKSQYDGLSRQEFDELLNDPNFDVRKLLK